MKEPELTIRLSLGATPHLILAIDNWRRAQPEIPSRAAAARLLLEQALKAHGYPTAGLTLPAKGNAAARKRAAPLKVGAS